VEDAKGGEASATANTSDAQGKEQVQKMKRLPLLLATVGLALLLSAGVAFADTFDCIANRGCIGTDGPDTLNGSAGDDFMNGGQDSDRLFGNGGHDSMDGDAFAAPNNDTSTDGNDILRGGPGFDGLFGYGGADVLAGGERGDFIFAEESSENEGEDSVYGFEGNDFILARDGVRDIISCGAGARDVVFFDKGGVDVVDFRCEFRNRFPGEFSSAASFTSGRVDAEKVRALRAR
jgi:hypothetical protein